MEIGGNLNIASQQDTENYKERNSSIGGTIGFGANMPSSISASRGKTDSSYASVQEQSGIFAGQGGFNINVGSNTDLKGAVIASDATPDKNKLSTGTLTHSDIENKAEYKATGTGISLSTEIIKPDGKFNYEGNNTYRVGTDGSVSGVTRAAVEIGTIEVRNSEAQTQAVNNLSWDTKNANGSIAPIFDKEKVQEELEFQKVLIEEVKKELEKKPEDKKKITNARDIEIHADLQHQINTKGVASVEVAPGIEIVTDDADLAMKAKPLLDVLNKAGDVLDAWDMIATQLGPAAPVALVFTKSGKAVVVVGKAALKAEDATDIVRKTGVTENVVYVSKNADDVVQYVGITNNIARRQVEHLRTKGIDIRPLMEGLSRDDAKAVEQALIQIHGLERTGGTLINKINSIALSNPSYAQQLQKGYELLKTIGYME
jgi:hypothetical protein